MKSILLVSPLSENEALWVTGDETAEVKNNFPPLGLATIAALTPPERFHVQLWDENVHGCIDEHTDLGRDYDLVGFTGFNIHLRRCAEVAQQFRARGVLTAIGGPGISSAPHAFRSRFDILFINEAEYTWPQFLRDWEAGQPKPEYRQIEKPELAESPLPRWDSIAADMRRYSIGMVQTTRGCPFDCEFCDVIYLFGRRPRHKPMERVLEEIRVLAGHGFATIFLADDEFSGDRHYSKALCRELIKLNQELGEPLTFTTQISLSISRDEEFLDLLASANFDLVFIGVETVSEESLRGANKIQNVRGGDIVDQIHKILSYGIGIRAGLIVGFDEDDANIFERQLRFIQASFLTSFGINMLKAPLGTRLWQRLMREQRVVDLSPNRHLMGHPRSYTNIIPTRLTRVELMQGFRDLMARAYTWENFAERMRGFVSLVQREPPPHGPEAPVDENRLVAEVHAQGDAAEVIREIVRHTKAVAPFMMRKVRTLAVQHARYLETLERLLPQLDSQIELEQAGKMVLRPDTRLFPSSVEFRKAFDEAFASVHRRVYANLDDRSRVGRALTEVFVDFLVRWGEDFRGLEPQHLGFLEELSDRTCAQLNGQDPTDFVARDSSAIKVPNIKRLRLPDDVFKNVWMEINEFRMTGTRQADREAQTVKPTVMVGQLAMTLSEARHSE